MTDNTKNNNLCILVQSVIQIHLSFSLAQLDIWNFLLLCQSATQSPLFPVLMFKKVVVHLATWRNVITNYLSLPHEP